MELRQLHYFLKAKELMNFTAAAEAVHISQSTLSQQIKQLEIELELPLFDRIGKRIKLTEAGGIFAEFAQKIVQSSQDSKLALADLKAMKAGKISIGISYGLRFTLLPAIKKFIEKYPLVTLDIHFDTTDHLVKMVQEGLVNMVLSFKPESIHPELSYQKLFTSEMLLVTAEKSIISDLKSISLKNLAQLPLAMPAKGFSTTDAVFSMFHAENLIPNVKLTINDIPTLLAVVKEGNLSTVLAKSTVENENHVACIPISTSKLTKEGVLIFSKYAYRTIAMQKLIDEIV